MKVSHLQTKQKALKSQLKGLLVKDGDLSDEDKAEIASLKSQITDMDDRIESLKELADEEAKAAEPYDNADEVTASKSLTPRRYTDTINDVRKTASYDKPGFKFARYAMGQVLCKKEFRGDIHETANFIERRFNDGLVAKALVSNVTNQGGALIPQDFYAEVVELLRSMTVVRKAGPVVIQSNQANLTLPTLASGSQATYSKEAEPIGVSNQSFGTIQFGVHKLTNISVVSNDLIRRAAIGVEEIVRDDLVQGIARREDLAFLTGDGSVGDPIGFTNLVLPGNVIGYANTVVPTTGNADVLAMILNTINNLQLTLEVGNSRMIKPTWIASPAVKRFIAMARDGVGNYFFNDLRTNGTLDGIPFLTTNQLPTNLVIPDSTTLGQQLILVDMADVVITDSYSPTIELSGEASVTISGIQTNLFQNDLSALRIIQEHDMQMRHLQSLAVAELSGWVPTGFTGVAGAPFSTDGRTPTDSNAPSAVIK